MVDGELFKRGENKTELWFRLIREKQTSCYTTWSHVVNPGNIWSGLVTSDQQDKKKASPPRSAISFSGIKTMSFWRLKDPEGKRPRMPTSVLDRAWRT